MNTLQKNIRNKLYEDDCYIRLDIRNEIEFNKIINICFKNGITWCFSDHSYVEFINHNYYIDIGINFYGSISLFKTNDKDYKYVLSYSDLLRLSGKREELE